MVAFSILSRIVGAATAGGPDKIYLRWTFSILSRIVGAATDSTHRSCSCVNFLSVSSVGSWALQPKKANRSGYNRFTFSILSRIVGAATIKIRGETVEKNHFQYPQSDRGRCNHSFTQLLRFCRRAFSILSRIVGAATTACPPTSSTSGILSVSSVGSWALQHSRPARHRNQRQTFQYPQSDRGRCNSIMLAGGGCGARPFSILSRIVGAATLPPVRGDGTWSRLSVSSVGSWALQRRTAETNPEKEWSFSILSRIVGAATTSSTSGICPGTGLSVSSVGSWALQPTLNC